MESTNIDKLKEGERVSRNIILINLALAIFKGFIGFISGSMVLLTDAVHTASDSITNFASWFGLKIAQKEPDEKFPYGYYRAETISTFFISIFLLFIGYELISKSYENLFVLSELEFPYLALGVSLSSSIIAFFISGYEKKIGKKINSQSLILLSKESRIDIFTSLVVFIGILCTYLHIMHVEGIVGIIISFIIFKIAIENGKNSIFSLMDVSPSKEIERKIEKIIKSANGVEGVKDLKLRYMGPFIIGNVKIGTKKFLTVGRSHEIADKIENEIKGKIKEVDSFLIHVEPYKMSKQKVVIPVADENGLDSKLSEHFGRSKYFIFIDIEKNKIKSWSFKKNIYIKKKNRAGLFFIEKTISKEKIDAVITNSIGSISFHTLRDNLIGVYLTDRKNVKTCVNDFISNKLERLEKPTKKLGQEKIERGN